MKKNILILITTACSGGAESLILNQMKYYDKTKFNLHVVTLRKGYLEKEFSSNKNAHYFCLDAKRRISLTTINKLKWYIRINNIDLIHTHLYLPDVYGFLIKLLIPKIKLITTKHNTNEFRKKLYWGLFDKLLSFPADQIIAVSKSVKRFISKYEFIPSQKIKVIYHGIDVSRFKEKKDYKRLQEKLNIKDNDFVIGIVGRIIEQKGHKYLLKAIANLKEKITHPKLLIIGVGELSESLEKYADELKISKNIFFLGYRNDLSELYSLMDVLCLPSIFEGLGLTIVEAMLCNTITIGAKIHGIEEVIDDGINGFLFPPKNSNKLTDLLYKIYQDDFDREMIPRARSKALIVFDFRKNLKNIEKVYLDKLQI